MPSFVQKSGSQTTASATPRRVRAVEAEIIKRLLHFAETTPHFDELFASVEHLMVQEDCECGCGSLYFDDPRHTGFPVAEGIGLTPDNHYVEVFLWARDAILTFLEVEPLSRPQRLERLPRVESLAPHPAALAGEI